MSQSPVTIQIRDPQAIAIVINEANRRGITYGGGRQIATAIIKEWDISRRTSSNKFQVKTKEVTSYDEGKENEHLGSSS
jgi:hypothetical protein